jgi:hypothetical protein
MRAIGSRSAWRTLVVLGVPTRGNGILVHAIHIIELFSLSGPSASVEARMLGGTVACRWIRRPIQAIELVGQCGESSRRAAMR